MTTGLARARAGRPRRAAGGGEERQGRTVKSDDFENMWVTTSDRSLQQAREPELKYWIITCTYMPGAVARHPLARGFRDPLRPPSLPELGSLTRVPLPFERIPNSMARVTVEDCLEQEENRFALVVLAASRTRQLMKGAPLAGELQEQGRRSISLREIAAGKVRFHRDSSEVVQEYIAELATRTNLVSFARRSVARREARRDPVSLDDIDRARPSGRRRRARALPRPRLLHKTYKTGATTSSTTCARPASSGGPVLEYGIGNGRVALPIARAGHRRVRRRSVARRCSTTSRRGSRRSPSRCAQRVRFPARRHARRARSRGAFRW